MTHQVVPKLSIRGLCNSHTGPESRVWEQPDVSPCMLNVGLMFPIPIDKSEENEKFDYLTESKLNLKPILEPIFKLKTFFY